MKFFIALFLFLSLLFSDSITLKNGKRIDGFIQSRSLEFVTIQDDDKSYIIPCENIKEIESCPNYLRIVGDELQTKTVVLEKDGKLFTFCSMVHVADRGFYRKVESILDKNQVVLYEAFGVKTNEDFSKWRIPKEKYYSFVTPYSSQGNGFFALAKILGLHLQLEELNTQKPFWVPSDISIKKFNSLLKKQQAQDFFKNMFTPPDQKKLAKDRELDILFNKVFQDQNNKILKKYSLRKLAENILEGENAELSTAMEVILNKRNEYLVKDILECVRNKSLKKIGVNYGSFHTHGIVKELKKRGFIWVSEEWITAWKL